MWLAAACAPADDISDSSAVPPDSVPPDAAAAVAPLPGEGPTREYRILLVNPLETDAHVFAAAGAGSVVLDTVPRRDSVRVNIRVRAGLVRLEARDAGGLVLAEIDLALARDTLNRWVIDGDASARPVTIGPQSSLIGREALYCGSDLCRDSALDAALGAGTMGRGDAMKKFRIALALVASIAMIVVGQRQVGQKEVRTQKADIQGVDSDNEALFI